MLGLGLGLTSLVVLGGRGAAVVVAPVNTVLPAISGTAQAGRALTVSNGTWTGTPTSYAYQWERGGTPIVGATAATHAVISLDEGAVLTCVVTATNAGGSTPAESAATAVVLPFILNGGFADDSQWTLGTGWTIAGGKATHISGTAANLTISIPTAVNGKGYPVTFDLGDYVSGGMTPKFLTPTSNGTTRTAAGTWTETITANGAHPTFSMTAGATGAFSIDNVYVEVTA